MLTPNCPETQTLVDFLLGKLSSTEIEDCRQHLEDCDPCVETIRGLKVDDDTLNGLSREAWLNSAKKNGSSESQVIADLMNRMEGLSILGRTAVHSDADIAQDRAAEVQRLLSPSLGENELGRIGKYRVVQLLGAGSTGVVYQAIDDDLSRTVAIKILRPSLGALARERFMAEAKATAMLSHPNVVPIYDVGIQGALAFIAMAWEPGQTLSELLSKTEHLPVEETRELATRLAEALAHAHQRGLIHRDIKPANVWISDERGVAGCKILDFGLVRIADEDPQLTCTGMIAGTPCYMSPEQSRGQQLDGRSDLFSLGCVIYQALTGQLPFCSDNALSTLQSIQRDQPVPPQELDPAIPEDLSDLVMCLLEKSPNHRPPNAESVARALNCKRDEWPFQVALSQPNKPELKSTRPALGRNSRTWKFVAAMLLGLALGISGLMYGTQIIRIVTNEGIIEIDSSVDDVVVEVLQDGQQIRVIDLATEEIITLKAGAYEIRPLGNENSIEIKNNKLTLLRGGKQIVTITRMLNEKSESASGFIAQLPPMNNSSFDKTKHKPIAQPAPSASHRLSRGDTLGIFIEGVLGRFEDSPPIHIPESATEPPTLGFPITINEDGNITLPLVSPVSVAGKTVPEAQKLIDDAYKKGAQPILKQDGRIVVCLMRIGSSSNHKIDTNDVLGVFVDAVLGKFEDNPPIHIPPVDSGLPPSMGYPILVQADGSISLPLVEPIQVRGKSVAEAQAAVRTAFTQGTNPVLKPEARILVSLIRSRDYVPPAQGETFVPNSLKSTETHSNRESTTETVDSSPETTTSNDLLAGLIENSYETRLRQLDESYQSDLELFKHERIDQVQLLESEGKLVEYQLNFGYRPDAERHRNLQRMLEIRQKQFEIAKFMFDHPLPPGRANDSSPFSAPEIKSQDPETVYRDTRSQLASIRTQLRQFELSTGIQSSIPIHDGKTYEECLNVARTERDLSKLLPALTGLANLASETERDEAAEAIMEIVRRGTPLASAEARNQFGEFKRMYFGSMSVEQLVELTCREIATGNQMSILSLTGGISWGQRLHDKDSNHKNVQLIASAVAQRFNLDDSKEVRRDLLRFFSYFDDALECDPQDCQPLKEIYIQAYLDSSGAGKSVLAGYPVLVAKLAPLTEGFVADLKKGFSEIKSSNVFETLIAAAKWIPENKARELVPAAIDAWIRVDSEQFPSIEALMYFNQFPAESRAYRGELERRLKLIQNSDGQSFDLMKGLIDKIDALKN